MKKQFAIIGAAGYIAPRHLKAIKDTNNALIAAMDLSDSVGILDSYFPDAKFFTDFEIFDSYISEQNRIGNLVDYISITSPNYLHKAHMSCALRAASNVICEKPLVLNPSDLDDLLALELETARTIYTVLQLRLHPSILSLKELVNSSAYTATKKRDVDLTYITSRGPWYSHSWKGEIQKSGGIATNIGVHFFDMLHFVFGELQESVVHLKSDIKASGYLEYENARVRWYLSVDLNDLPVLERKKGKRTYRCVLMDGHNIEFSEGFEDLHTRVYEEILAGRGFGISDNRVAIQTVADIRNSAVSAPSDFSHPFLNA